MLGTTLKPIENEINDVNRRVQKQLHIKAGYIGDFAHLELSSSNRVVRPALVLLSARLYGFYSDTTTTLACVFQLIFMASKVHERIPENDSDYTRGDTEPRDGSQLPVLVGDYLYGKFFYFLYEAGLLNLLKPIAEMICQIHEGGILREKAEGHGYSSQAFHEIVRKESAELFASCCSMGARLAGAPENDVEYMRRFGHNLGMAYGFLEQGIPMEYCSSYLREALACLAHVPERPEKIILEQMICSMTGQSLAVRRMVI